MLIAAMVIVMISRGMEAHPITPSTAPDAKRFGNNAIRDTFHERNKIKNMQNKAATTIPSVMIWERNKLCSILLYNTIIPVSRN